MEGSSELLMKFEQAKGELEQHLDTTRSILLDHDLRRSTLNDDLNVHDLLQEVDSLTEIVRYLLSWRLHSVKRSINMINEMMKEEDEENKTEHLS